MKNEPRSDKAVGHYVYIYRDGKGKVRYVGYGKGLDRPTSLNRGKSLPNFRRKERYTLEIAGPFGSRATGMAVETALISSHRPNLNSPRAPGKKQWQFRPLGVPERFSKRLDDDPLNEDKLVRVAKGRACPFLFVFIGSKAFDDGREGYSLNKPPSDAAILARMEKKWQLGRYLEAWRTHPHKSPRVLVAVTGPPSHRIIVGAVKIDQEGWREARPESRQLYKVPTLKTPKLDAYRLRGRLLSPSANIKFGGITPLFFVILNRNGKTVGGQT
jgi:hypothetical protein